VCGASNEEASKFCSNCGTPLVRVCPKCGSSNQPTANYCANCGNDLTESAGEPQPAYAPVSDPGERRFVSAMFADLVGFTPFTESRDPEEVRAMLTRYFEKAHQIVEGFGGEVDKFIGDAVTAFWGAKVAREDDAERAVRAALELVDAVSELGQEIGVPGLALRAGVLSGHTSVGTGGNETGLVVGDIVNTAARLQSIAEPGTVYVGDSTKDLSAASIRYEHAGEHELKGKSEPVTAWHALDVVAARGGRGRSEGLEPPFVGREFELRLLKDQLHATAHEGRARLVSMVGEGGIGKSRLAWELQKYIDGLAETFFWHQGRSPAYGDGVTFWALGEMVRQRARIAETDSPGKARTRLQTSIADYVGDAESSQWIAPRLAGLLGLGDMPDGGRADLFAALRSFFQHIAERGPVVLVFEDTHWADEGLLDFIVELVERSPNHPILVVTLGRPALLDRHQDWGTVRRGFTSAHLGPLADIDMRALVEGMTPGIEEATVDLVVHAAAGVPLYAVEYVRTLVSSGDLAREGDRFRQVAAVDSLSLPDSLHAVVAARIDRLDAVDRSVIQDASVLGQSFPLDALEMLSGMSAPELAPVLARLVRNEILLLDDDPRSPERGYYQFVQSVIREVTYGRLARPERKRRHVAVARHFEAADLAEFAAVIASHYMSALDTGPDEELAAAARTSMLAAAQRASDLYSHTQALALVEQALKIPGDEAERVGLWELGSLAASMIRNDEVGIGMARELFEWQQEHGDQTTIEQSARVLGHSLISADRPVEAVAVMAPHFVPGRANEAQMMILGAELARAHMLTGESQLSADVARDTLMAAEAAGNTEVVVETLNTRGTALAQLRRTYEARALLGAAIDLAAEVGSPWAEARALNNYLVIDASNGCLASARILDRFFEIAERLGAVDFIIRSTTRRLVPVRVAGRFQEALDGLTAVEIDRESWWGISVAADVGMLKWVLSADSTHLEAALTTLDGAPEGHEPQFDKWIRSQRASVLFLQGKSSQAYEMALSSGGVGRLDESDSWVIPIWVALRLNDASLLTDPWGEELPMTGRRFEYIRTMAAAAEAALGNRADEAVALADRAYALCEAADGVLPAMILRSIMGEVMPNNDDARASARLAFDWFTEHEAAGYLALFADLWETMSGSAEVG